MTENFTNDFFFGGGVSIGPHVKNILLFLIFLIFANPFFFSSTGTYHMYDIESNL